MSTVKTVLHRATGSRWPGRSVIGAVLGIWATVAAFLAAVLLAIVWDLRP